MININQTSENSKIYIQRNITNDEPVINNYVTEDELSNTLKNYATTEDLSNVEVDLTGYATEQWVDDKGYLKEIPEEYITETELADKNYVDTSYLNGELEAYAKQSYVDDAIANVGNGNIVELTQEEYNNTIPEPDTLYVISDAPAVEIDTSEFITESELNSKGYTTSNSFKTINNQSIVGSGNITIEAGGTEILYLWKLNGTTTYGADHNANVRNTLLSLSSSEEYPIIVVKDYNNDTICNNVYANASTDYVEIQCCNSRIGGTPNDLTDERYELLPNGMFRYVKNDVVATQNYVDEKISDINIESGGNIVELTQSEYNSITPEPDTLYLISDSNINTTLKTINGESIIGEGDIKVEASVDLTGYATEQWVEDKGYAKLSYVEEQIGNINNVLENIIG